MNQFITETNTSKKKKEKNLLLGFLLIVMGIVFRTLSHAFGGTVLQDYLSGLMLGLSIVEMLVGIYLVGRSIAGR